ncbi:hypothetical protein DBP20_09240 [Streptomyces sp. CS131]|nr:hypothetical protein DBP20_09240 [Streptomyces sp. CS131]
MAIQPKLGYQNEGDHRHTRRHFTIRPGGHSKIPKGKRRPKIAFITLETSYSNRSASVTPEEASLLFRARSAVLSAARVGLVSSSV